MSRRIRVVLSAMLLLAALFASVKAISFARDAGGVAGLWRARYEAPQPLPVAWPDVSQNKECRFVLYHETGVLAEAPLFGREKRLTLVKSAGDASLLFLPGRLTAGGYPGDDAPRGCVIDENSALELWGTIDASGLSVIADGAEYEVTGVVRAARPLLLANTGEEPDFVFSGVYFSGGMEDAFPRQAFERALSSLSDDPPHIDETGLLADLLRFLARLPLWAFSLFAAWRCVSAFPQVFRRRSAKTAALAVFAAVSFLILGMPNIVTPDMLPTRFSDFTFWPGRIEALLEQLYSAWFLRGSLSGLLLMLELVLPVTGYALLSAAAFVLSVQINRFNKSL